MLIFSNVIYETQKEGEIVHKMCADVVFQVYTASV